jgi:hypothetical protein
MLADVNDLKGVDAGAGAEELLGASFGATILLGLDRGLDKLRVGAVRMRGIVQMGMGRRWEEALFGEDRGDACKTIRPVFGCRHSVVGYIYFIYILGQSF